MKKILLLLVLSIHTIVFAQQTTAKGAEIKKAINEPQATSMLNQNYYNWFNIVERGVYEISEHGRNELPEWLEKINTVHIKRTNNTQTLF